MNTKICWHKLQDQVEVFADKLNASLEELGIADICRNLEIDHICIRLKDSADVEELKHELEEAGKIISAVNVNGREIMIIQLNQPIILSHWKIFGVELPYPKANHKYEDGWEHVEFILDCADNTMDGVRNAFVEKFPNLDIEKMKDAYSYSEDDPHAEGDQLPNPTIGLKVNGVGLKFHTNSIQEVVGYLN